MAFLQLFLGFFKVGLIGFGGGIAMLPLIRQSVQQFGYMSDELFRNLVALAQITPGAIGINTATFVGEEYAGMPGSIVATTSICIPSFILVILAVKFYNKYKNTKAVSGIMSGIMPAAVGLIAAAFVFIASGVLWTGHHLNIIPIAMFAVSSALSIWNKINPVLILIGMGVIGVFVFS